jgi:hypothetical protein
MPKILPLHAAENQHLQDHPEQSRRHEGYDEAEQPRTGQILGFVTDISAEQIDRSMREIDVSHQSEDQREAARDQKIQPAQRDPVEQRVEENLLLADRVLEALRPGPEDQPDRQHDDDHDHDRPKWMAFDKAVHPNTLANPAGAKRMRRVFMLPLAMTAPRPPEPFRGLFARLWGPA